MNTAIEPEWTKAALQRSAASGRCADAGSTPNERAVQPDLERCTMRVREAGLERSRRIGERLAPAASRLSAGRGLAD